MRPHEWDKKENFMKSHAYVICCKKVSKSFLYAFNVDIAPLDWWSDGPNAAGMLLRLTFKALLGARAGLHDPRVRLTE